MPSFQDFIVAEVAVETRKERFRGSIFGIRQFLAAGRAPKAINILSSECSNVDISMAAWAFHLTRPTFVLQPSWYCNRCAKANDRPIRIWPWKSFTEQQRGK